MRVSVERQTRMRFDSRSVRMHKVESEALLGGGDVPTPQCPLWHFAVECGGWRVYPFSSTRVPVQFLHLATQVCSPHLLINKGNKIKKQVSDWHGKVVSGQSAEALVNVGGRI